jgi:hypothetical protein
MKKNSNIIQQACRSYNLKIRNQPTAANTDNKGNLFVMLFAGFLSLLPGEVVEAKPGSAPLSETNYFAAGQFLTFAGVLYRERRAAALYQISISRQICTIKHICSRPRHHVINLCHDRQKARHTCLATGTTSCLKHQDL